MVFVLPFLIFVVAIFLLPLLATVFYSFGQFDPTLDYFAKFFQGQIYRTALRNTIEISIISALLTLLAAYPVAYHLSKQTPKRRLLLTMILLLPFYTSILVKSFAFTVALGHLGILNTALRNIFGPDAGVQLLYNRIGVFVGLVHNLLPYMVFPILTNLLAQDQNLPKAAELMGASRSRIFWKITFPLSLPGVAAGILLATVLTLGQYITPALLGGRKDLMMANLVEFHISYALNWNMASAIAVILLSLAGLIIILLSRIKGVQLFEGKAAP